MSNIINIPVNCKRNFVMELIERVSCQEEIVEKKREFYEAMEKSGVNNIVQLRVV